MTWAAWVDARARKQQHDAGYSKAALKIRAHNQDQRKNNGFTSLFQEAEFISEGSNRSTAVSNK
jgi:hypothetical protein